jgi:chromosomal replication initiation ATPase DnaA
MFVAKYRNTERGARERLRLDPSIREEIIAKARNEAKEVAENIIAEARIQASDIIAEAYGKATIVLGRAGMEGGEKDHIPALDLIREIAEKHGILVADIKSQSRAAAIVEIRHEAVAYVYQRRPDLSLAQIGRIFGRDHTTILHSVRKAGVYRGLSGYRKQT